MILESNSMRKPLRKEWQASENKLQQNSTEQLGYTLSLNGSMINLYGLRLSVVSYNKNAMWR
mgnify:CR=1 FL=1